MRRLFSSRVIVAAVIVAVALGGVMLSRVGAQSAQANLSATDAMRLALNEQMGKRVRVKLASGQDLEGHVAGVGTHAAALTQLTGLEFYNAPVAIDQIAAVIVRAPGK
jgi:hypothetical protein